MKPLCFPAGLTLVVGLALAIAHAQIDVTPRLGGGQVAADMVHIDIYYDADANEMHARVDDSFGVPHLRPLEPGFTFDAQAAFSILSGKAHNAQYGWNAGGFFTIPAGAAIWIEQLDASPGVEVYEGWGWTGSYVPLFGTTGSPRRWRWSGVMTHNTYAILEPVADRFFAEYRIYFGDANTGSPEGYTDLDDARIRLEWTADPVEAPFRFGAVTPAAGTPVAFLNADHFTTQGERVLTLAPASPGLPASPFERTIPMMVLPATASHGGPLEGHPALGACIEFQLVALSGPPGARLSVWDGDAAVPLLTAGAGVRLGSHRIPISENNGLAGTDPYGRRAGRRFSVDQPGFYTLAFQLVDTSTSGSGGGPLHSASEVYHIFLQAGVTLAGAEWQDRTFIATFGGSPGWDFRLERSVAPRPGEPWQTVAGPLTGTNRLQRLADPGTANSRGWYRLRADPN